MTKVFVLILLAVPVALRAQIPIPALPDWIRPSQNSAQVLNQTYVALGANNYVIVDSDIVARSRGFKLLGLITFRSPSYAEAMSRLYHKGRIQEGRSQALANVVHETTSSYFILFSVPKVTIRADLIEFIGEGGEEGHFGDPMPALLKYR